MHAYLAFSEAGGGQTNEDAYQIMPHPQEHSLLLCALADGQGGRPGAKMAAQLACETVVKSAAEYSPRQLTKTRTWSKILSQADSMVYNQADAGVTTLLALCITKNAVYGASSGDSATVLLNVYDQVHLLTADQQKNPPVGSGVAKAVPFEQCLIEPWRLVLMSDGVWKYTGWSHVLGLIKRYGGETLIEALAESACLENGGFGYRDDVTVVIVESEGEDN